MAALDDNVKRILIIDRDPIVQFYQRKLAEAGHVAIVTSKGQDGILEAIAFHPDLIFIDPDLPGENGLDVIGGLRSLPGLKGVPIVVMTHTDEERIIEESLKAGATDILFKKDIMPNEVLAKAMGVLQGLADTISLTSDHMMVKAPKPIKKSAEAAEEKKEKIISKTAGSLRESETISMHEERAIPQDPKKKFAGTAVLIIDEDPFFVRTYTTKLDMDGFKPIAESNLDKIKEIIRTQNPQAVVMTLYFAGLKFAEELFREGLFKDRGLILLTATVDDCKNARVLGLKGVCFEKAAMTPAILSSAIVASLLEIEKRQAEELK